MLSVHIQTPPTVGMIGHLRHQVHYPRPAQLPGINRVAVARATPADGLTPDDSGRKHDFLLYELPVIGVDVALKSREFFAQESVPLGGIVGIVDDLAGPPRLGVIDPAVVCRRVLIVALTDKL